MLPVCGTDRVGEQPQRLCSFPAPFVAPLPHHGPCTLQHGDTECSWSAESPWNRKGTDSPGGWKQVSFWGGNLSTQPFLSSSLFFSRSPLSHYFMVCQHLPATCLRNSILLPTGRPEPYWFSLYFTLLSCTWTPSPFASTGGWDQGWSGGDGSAGHRWALGPPKDVLISILLDVPTFPRHLHAEEGEPGGEKGCGWEEGSTAPLSLGAIGRASSIVPGLAGQEAPGACCPWVPPGAGCHSSAQALAAAAAHQHQNLLKPYFMTKRGLFFFFFFFNAIFMELCRSFLLVFTKRIN